jgi:hypothetical protein
MAIIKIRNAAIDLDAAEIPNLDASKITTGNFDASRIGSGTFADARISASSVSQHATSFDDNKIVNDISTLAIRQASDQNKSAYNTNSQSVDVFQDDTGIDTSTDVSRNTSEYVSSQVYGTLSQLDYFNPTQAGGGTTNYQVYWNNAISQNGTWYDIETATNRKYVDFDTSLAKATGGYYIYWQNPNSDSYYVIIDYKETKRFTDKFKIAKHPTWGDVRKQRISYSTDNVTYTNLDLSGTSQLGSTLYSTSGYGGGNYSNQASDGTFEFTQYSGSGAGTPTIGFTVQNVPAFEARYVKLSFLSKWVNTDTAGGIFTPYTQPIITNATGNFTGTTITALSSVSSMGAIITYQDFSGTNALNTDIVLQLSADGGSNYSTATLTALPNFATGIKMAKVNDLAVTAGTNLKYKLSFANQASGTKEARIRGVALQY